MKSMLPIVTAMAASAFAAPTVASAQVAQSAPKVQAAGPGNSSGVTIIGSYYEDRATVNCSNFTNCFLTFSAIPAKKKLIVTTVSCAFKTGNRAIQLFFYEANGPVGGKYRQLNIPVSDYVYATDIFQPSRAVYYTTINAATRYYFRTGTNPQINFFTSGGNTYFHEMSCTILGSISNV